MPSSINITQLHTTAALEETVAEWRDLWSRDPIATPFQRPEWLLPWWHHFGQPDLHVACMRRDGILVGLVPLYVYPDPVRGERQLLLIGAGTSDYLDGIFAPECTGEDIAGLVADVARQGRWDVAHLTQMRKDSRLLAAIVGAAPAGLRFWPGEPTSRCHAVPR